MGNVHTIFATLEVIPLTFVAWFCRRLPGTAICGFCVFESSKTQKRRLDTNDAVLERVRNEVWEGLPGRQQLKLRGCAYKHTF